MKKVCLITVFYCLTLCLLSPAGTSAPLSSVWQGYYVGKTDRPGRAQEVLEVDIIPVYEGKTMWIDFMISGNPPGHILGATAEAGCRTSKQFKFDFKDNQGNKGRGTFFRRGKNYVLHLEFVRHSSSGVVTDYSSLDYVLAKKETKGRADRHPWSLNRVRPGPGRPLIPGYPY
jgi:hypothetical protein